MNPVEHSGVVVVVYQRSLAEMTQAAILASVSPRGGDKHFQGIELVVLEI